MDPSHFDTYFWNENAEDQPRLDDIRRAVDKLPADLRIVVEGLYWEGVSQRELARRLGVSKDEIRKRLRQAKKRLSQTKEVQSHHPVGQVSADSERARPVFVPPVLEHESGETR